LSQSWPALAVREAWEVKECPAALPCPCDIPLFAKETFPCGKNQEGRLLPDLNEH
jgi:hypothetical protein